MRGKTRRSLVLLLCALCALSAVAFAATADAKHKKKQHTVKMKTTKTCAQVGTKICATYGGKPFGSCKMTGTLTIPTTTQTWKCSKGSFVVTAVSTTGAANDVKGTWKVGKGKGKYKGISGKGEFHGKLSTQIFFYNGKAKY